MKLPLTIVAALLLTGAAPPSALSFRETPSALMAEVARKGPGEVVARLSQTDARWSALVARISGGRSDWLSVAKALRPGADASTGEDLTYAVASALRRNPGAVLALAGPAFPISDICEVRLIEPSPAQYDLWKREVLTALTWVKAASLSDKVEACRATMEHEGAPSR